jgi:hypothetical protein
VNTYSKIETLFERDERFKVIVGRYRRPEYEDISRWLVSEKIDGTNVRINFTRVVRVHSTGPEPDEHVTDVRVRGKTDNASLPTSLSEHCFKLAAAGLDYIEEQLETYNVMSITLHGEGYGAKIQNGGNYRSDQGFILFDVEINDSRTFLDEDTVSVYAYKLQIPRVPLIGLMTTEDIVEAVSNGFTSRIGGMAEGVVVRPRTPLYDNRGERVMWKLKTKDFAGPVAHILPMQAEARG